MAAKDIQPISGASYFFQGFQLIRQPGLRTFVLIPLLVNLLLFGGAFYYLYLQLGDLINWMMSYVPSFLDWLRYLIWPVAVLSVLFVFSFLFTTLANIIAAPFNGLLAEKVELYLTGQPLKDEGALAMVKDVPRSIGREFAKLRYYLPKALGCLILFLIPLVGQTLAPLLWFLLSCWMMSVQYVDYGFDNHKVSFSQMIETMKQKRTNNLSFGLMVTLFSAIPFVNLLVMPVAVCGGTAMWVAEYRNKSQHH